MFHISSRLSATDRRLPARSDPGIGTQIRNAAHLFAALFLVAAATSNAQPRPSYVFASGPQGGTYYELASLLASRLKESGAPSRIEVRETAGSYENVQLLRDRKAQVALVQGDVAFLEHFETRSFSAIAALYTEPVQIIARKELGFHSVSDILAVPGSLGVGIGPAGSGTASQALTLLEELEARPGHLERYSMTIQEMLDKLRRRELDIAFLSSAAPDHRLAPILRDNVATLLAVDADIADRIAMKYPFFSITDIPYTAYSHTKHSVRTLGTTALLVTGKQVGPGAIDNLLDALYHLAAHADEQRLPFLAGLTPTTGLDKITIPANPVAIDYQRRHSSRFNRIFRLARHYAIPTIILLTPLLVLLRLSRFAYFIHQFMIGRTILLLLVVWLVGSALMYLIESGENSAFRTLGKSSIAILHYLFSGLESEYPITLTGNIVAILILTFGVAVVTFLTASIVTLLLERVLDVKSLRPKPWRRIRLKGHAVIVGWSLRTERILAQLRSKDLRRKPPVVVITRDKRKVRLTNNWSYRQAWTVEGEPASSRTLERADVATAECALILGEPDDEGKKDLEAIATTLAIESLESRVRTIVEAESPEILEHLRESSADEIVQINELGARMLSQALITPGIAKVYDELLTFGRRSQEIYVAPLPRKMEGLSYTEVQLRLARAEILMIGLQQSGDGRLVVNPRKREGGCGTRMHEGDNIIFLADCAASLTGWRARRAGRSTTGRRAPVETHGEEPSTHALESKQSPCEADHIRVGICGWNRQAEAVLDQLRDPVISRHHRFHATIIYDPASDDVARGRKAHSDDDGVEFFHGDASRRRVLEDAGIGSFSSLLILADRAGGVNPRTSDQRSLVTALAAEDAAPDLHKVVEVLDSQSCEHFSRIPSVEFVSIQDLSEKLLAQAVVSPGITHTFQELLTATERSNEIYITPVLARWIGSTFEGIFSDLARSPEAVTLVGFRTVRSEAAPQALVLNPPCRRRLGRRDDHTRDYEMQDGDSLVVMAYEEPVWS